MSKLPALAVAVALGAWGCGSSLPVPAQRDAAGEVEVDAAADTAPAPPDGGDDARALDGRDVARDLEGSDAGSADSRDATVALDRPVDAGAPDGPDDSAAPDAAVAEVAPPVTLTFLRHDNRAFTRAQDQAFADYLAVSPNVTIAPTTVPWTTYTRALASDLARDQLAYDLVLMPPSATCTYAANLDDVPADLLTLGEASNTFFAAPLEGSTCGGKLEAVPVDYSLDYGGVVVNLDRYQARYPNKQPSWPDWTSFLAEASSLSRFDAAGKPCTNGLDIDPTWPEPVGHILLGQILQRGGRYWSASNPRLFDFGTQAARDALTEMVAWVNRDKVLSPALFPATNTFVTTRLVRGAAGYGCGDPSEPLSVMGYAGPWALASAIDQRQPGTDTRFVYAPLPPMVGVEHHFVQDAGFALAVPRTSKNRQAAWDVVRAIALSPATMRKWAATAGTLPALKANGTIAAAAADPLLAKVQPLLARGRWMGYVPYPALEVVRGAMVSNFYAAVKGTKTVDRALADMQEAANQAISQNP
jgi:multiple sugar transport system substrate-binding protein